MVMGPIRQARERMESDLKTLSAYLNQGSYQTFSTLLADFSRKKRFASWKLTFENVKKTSKATLTVCNNIQPGYPSSEFPVVNNPDHLVRHILTGFGFIGDKVENVVSVVFENNTLRISESNGSGFIRGEWVINIENRKFNYEAFTVLTRED